ncbi:MAG: sensor histidine kinase [Luteibaculum sp.]
MCRKNFEYKNAIQYYDSALSKCQSCRDSTLALIFLGKGKAQQNLNDPSKAAEAIKRAYDKRKAFKDINYHLYIEISLAEILRANRNFNLALQTIDSVSNRLQEEAVADSIISYYYNRLAPIQSEAKLDPSIALKSVEKALEYASQTGDTTQLILLYRELSNIHTGMGRGHLGIPPVKKAVELAEVFGDPRLYADALITMIQAFQNVNDYRETEKLGLQALAIANTHDFLQTRVDLLALLSKIYREKGEYKKALQYADSNYQAFQKLFNESWQERISVITQNLELEKKELALENEKLSKEAVQYELLQTQQKARFNRNILFFGAAVLFLLSGLSYLLHKNYRQQKKLAREREFLIREVHHRVKNNLQSLAGLLSLQINYLDDPKQIDLLQNVFRRVNAIALTHSMLYNNQNPNQVNAKTYLSELVKEIQISEKSEGRDFVSEVETEDVQVDFDQAVCLGIITNELITNSVKHAKPIGALSIKLSLLKNDGKVQFYYGDNGEVKAAKKETNSMGLRLIELALKRISGKKISTSPETFAFHFSFQPNN